MKIFISHIAHDSKAAQQIADELRNHQMQPWLAQADIQPGMSWITAISDAIKSADAVIVLLSKQASESPSLRSEISMAIAEQEGVEKIVIPVLVEKGAEVPFFLRSLQYIDMSVPEAFQKNIQRLITAILSLRNSGTIANTQHIMLSQADYLIKMTQAIAKEKLELQVDSYRKSTVLFSTIAIVGALTFIVAMWLSFYVVGKSKASVISMILGMAVGMLFSLTLGYLAKRRALKRTEVHK